MARIVDVQKNDCLVKILEFEKGIKGAAAYQWVKKVQELNPHIGNIDLIHPKERILIPDTLHETISPKVIWENRNFRDILYSLCQQKYLLCNIG